MTGSGTVGHRKDHDSETKILVIEGQRLISKILTTGL